MTYHFDTPRVRGNTDSPDGENVLLMRADGIDAATAPEIRDAIAARTASGVFGCPDITPAWYQAYVDWWRECHGFSMEKDWLLFTTEVVSTMSSIVRKLTTPAEQVLIQTPVCDAFVYSAVSNGRQVLESPLEYHGAGYEINFDDLERKLADPQTTLMLLSNPHSPVGKVWDPATLELLGMMAVKHHVTVVSDERCSDLTDPGHSYTPFAAVSESCRKNSITCVSPAETFHVAGLQTAAVIVPDAGLRHKVCSALNTDGIAKPGVFAVDTAITAFTKGTAWLDKRKSYIRGNKDFAATFIKKEIPSVRAVPSEATYLLWLDCSRLIGCAWEAASFILEETGLSLSPGKQYGKSGEMFLCMNVSCPRDILLDGLKRLRDGLTAYEKFVLDRC